MTVIYKKYRFVGNIFIPEILDIVKMVVLGKKKHEKYYRQVILYLSNFLLLCRLLLKMDLV